MATVVINGPPQRVTVTHVNSPNSFYVQLEANKKKITQLSSNINNWCNNQASLKYIPSTLENIDVIARDSRDNQWYRARILASQTPADRGKNEEIKAHVMYIDSGKEGLVCLKDIRSMQACFMTYAGFAVHCSLFDLAPPDENKPWDAESIHEFHRITYGQTLLMDAFLCEDKIVGVKLSCLQLKNMVDDQAISVRDVMIFLELARLKTHSRTADQLPSLIAHAKVDFGKPQTLRGESITEVMITSTTSPSDFYVVCKDKTYEEFLKLKETMKQLYNSKEGNTLSLFYPRTKLVCALKGSDGEWHRARVLSPPKQRKVTAFLVDTGSTVTIHVERLRKLRADFIKLPAQAIQCALADVCPLREDGDCWTEKVKIWFRKFVHGTIGTAVAVGTRQVTDSDPIAEVVLWKTSKSKAMAPMSINYLLVEKDLATSSGRWSTAIDKDIFSHSSQKKDRQQSVDKYCKGSNSSTETSPKSIPPNSPSHSPTKDSLHYHDQSKMCKKVLTIPRDEKERKKIQEEIHQAMKAIEDDQGIHSEDKTRPVYIQIVMSSYTSPSDFAIRVEEKEDDLNQLMETMQAYYSNRKSSTQKWRLNEFCSVRYPPDNLWYRGKILSFESTEEAEIELVDFGHRPIVNVSSLQTLPAELAGSMECASVRCHLANLVPAGSDDVQVWPQKVIDFMASQVKDKKLYMQVKGEVNKMGLPVDVIVEEEIKETAFDPTVRSYHCLSRQLKDQSLAVQKSPVKLIDGPSDDPFHRTLMVKGVKGVSPIATTTKSEESSTDSGKSSSTPPFPDPLKDGCKLGAQKKVTHEVGGKMAEAEVKGRTQKVVVCHIRSPNDFYVQLIANKKKVETLSHNVNVWCRHPSSTKCIPAAVDQHEFILAQYSGDNQWYRARVLSVHSPGDSKTKELKAHVFYIDYGNDEVVSQKNMRSMQQRFKEYQGFAVRCSLFDIAPYNEDSPWDETTVHEFHRMTEGKVLLMSALAKQDNTLEVDLTCAPSAEAPDDQFVSIRDILIFLELGRFKVHSDQATHLPTPPAYNKVDFIKPSPFQGGSPFDVLATSVSSPSDFFLVSLDDEYIYYLNMQEEMQKLYNNDVGNTLSLYYPRVGMVCALKGSDGEWHRAKVLSPPKYKKVTAYLVDTGETITVHYERLKKLHSDYIKLPAQAVQCTLADVCPLGGDTGSWSKESKLWFQERMLGVSGTAFVVSVGEVVEVVLWQESRSGIAGSPSINSLIVEQGLAHNIGVSSTAVVQGYVSDDSTSSSISHPVSEVIEDQSRLQYKSSLGKLESGLKATTLKQPSEEDTDYRRPLNPAPIAKSVANGAVDSKTQRRGKENRKKPVRQVKKAVRRRDEDAMPAVSAEANKDKIQEQIHQAMKAIEDDQGIHSEDKTPPVYIQIVMSSYTSPCDFTIRVHEKEEEFNKLMSAMQDYYRDLEPQTHSWKHNEFCAVKSPEDDLWYRGNIHCLNSPEEAQVDLVDLGHRLIVPISNLRPLTKVLGRKMECASVRCHLAELLPAGSTDARTWSQTSVEFMAKWIKNRKLFIKQEGDVNEFGVPVDIIVEEEIPETAFEPVSHSYHSLRQMIKDQGLAMPARKKELLSPSDGVVEDPFKRTIFAQDADSPSRTSSGTKMEETSGDSGKPFSSPTSPETSKHTGAEDSSTEPAHKAPPLNVNLYPLPECGSEIVVLPTYVDHAGIIYAQPKYWDEKIEHMSNELQRIYGNGMSWTPMDWEQGQLCVAQFQEDSMWYRAVVLEVSSCLCKVRYIDFGNAAWVKLENMFEMLPEIAEVHLLAYYCVLHEAEPTTEDGHWPDPVINHIHRLVVNFECKVRVMEPPDGLILQVTLTNNDGLCLPEFLEMDSLVTTNSDISLFYQWSAAISKVLGRSNPYETLDMGGVGETFKAVVTHVELPNVVYLQRVRLPESLGTDFVSASNVAMVNKEIDTFEDMARELNTTKSMPFQTLPEAGLRCAGKFTLDNTWYRAVCIERYPQNDSCLVVYVDYGTSEVALRANLRMLPAKFWTCPAQAMRCYFNIVPPSGPLHKWRKPSLVGVVDTLLGKELTARITQMMPFTVELLEEQDGEMRLAYEHLITSGLALLPADVDVINLLRPVKVDNVHAMVAESMGCDESDDEVETGSADVIVESGDGDSSEEDSNVEDSESKAVNITDMVIESDESSLMQVGRLQVGGQFGKDIAAEASDNATTGSDETNMVTESGQGDFVREAVRGEEDNVNESDKVDTEHEEHAKNLTAAAKTSEGEIGDAKGDAKEARPTGLAMGCGVVRDSHASGAAAGKTVLVPEDSCAKNQEGSSVLDKGALYETGGYAVSGDGSPKREDVSTITPGNAVHGEKNLNGSSVRVEEVSEKDANILPKSCVEDTIGGSDESDEWVSDDEETDDAFSDDGTCTDGVEAKL